jgi:hypothetical protein
LRNRGSRAQILSRRPTANAEENGSFFIIALSAAVRKIRFVRKSRPYRTPQPGIAQRNRTRNSMLPLNTSHLLVALKRAAHLFIRMPCPRPTDVRAERSSWLRSITSASTAAATCWFYCSSGRCHHLPHPYWGLPVCLARGSLRGSGRHSRAGRDLRRLTKTQWRGIENLSSLQAARVWFPDNTHSFLSHAS